MSPSMLRHSLEDAFDPSRLLRGSGIDSSSWEWEVTLRSSTQSSQRQEALCTYSPNRDEPRTLISAVRTESWRQHRPLSQLEELDGFLLHLKLTQGIRGQPRRSLPPRACCRSASSLDEEGDDESQFPFVLMANNLENSPCLLRTVNDASEITSEIVIKENSRRERETDTRTLPDHSFICKSRRAGADTSLPVTPSLQKDPREHPKGQRLRDAAPVKSLALVFSYKESSSSTPGIQELVRPRTRPEAVRK